MSADQLCAYHHLQFVRWNLDVLHNRRVRGPAWWHEVGFWVGQARADLVTLGS